MLSFCLNVGAGAASLWDVSLRLPTCLCPVASQMLAAYKVDVRECYGKFVPPPPVSLWLSSEPT
jgi:hypothetical protein